ncbi:MAG: spore germination protein [Clostridia bacterium]|nr:spore germination protein [Clostridia bacterium]
MRFLRQLIRGTAGQRRMILGKSPIPLEEVARRGAENRSSGGAEPERDLPVGSAPQLQSEGTPVPSSLDAVEAYIHDKFGEGSPDVVLRRLSIWTQPELDGLLFYIEGLTDRATVNLMALRSVMLSARAPSLDPGAIDKCNVADILTTHLLPSGQAAVESTMQSVIRKVLTGEAALFVEGAGKCLCFEAKGWEHRPISEPHTEKVVRGPREGFSELLRANTALVRRRLRTPNLRLDSMQVGELSRTDVVVAYIDGLTDPELVAKAKERLEAIVIDIVPDSGIIEELIEDYPYSPFPQIQYTERPDRFCAGLSEGLVGILVDDSPIALMAPANLGSFFQSAEDYYERFPFGGPLRFLRYVSGALALLLPATYVAVTGFHQEMLPTKLAMAIAGSHMPVPFPALVEAMLMEMALELIREAGIRLPDPVGQTLGFVGALLLGDAAVSAGLVSPIMVIVVAVTGLASFAVPHYPTGLAIRLLRFPLLFLGAWLGLYGVMAGLLAIFLHMGALTSFGVPFLEPLMRPAEVLRDMIWRSPVFTFERRPGYANPQDRVRQKRFIRTWSPGVAKRAQEAEKAGEMPPDRDEQGGSDNQSKRGDMRGGAGGGNGHANP